MAPVTMMRTVRPQVSRAIPAASEKSRLIAKSIVRAFESAAEALVEQSQLGELDPVAGNGDHGRVMVRGSRAAVSAAQGAVADDAGAATTLLLAADAWSDGAGAPRGYPLWGAGLRAAALVMSDESVSSKTAASALRAALDAVTAHGNARLGDKTLVDAFLPFVESFDNDVQAGLPLGPAWVNAADVATRSAEATASLTPRLGRARPLATLRLWPTTALAGPQWTRARSCTRTVCDRGRTARLLEAHGVTVVHPKVGDLVISYAIAVSMVTPLRLDVQLEHPWTLPARTGSSAKATRSTSVRRGRSESGHGGKQTASGAQSRGQPVRLAGCCAALVAIRETAKNVSHLDAIAHSSSTGRHHRG